MNEDKNLNKQEKMDKISLMYQAKMEGAITVEWHKMCEKADLDLGDSVEENIYFICFQAGFCEGGLLMNNIWLNYLNSNINTNEDIDE
jgi:hypothetical protein